MTMNLLTLIKLLFASIMMPSIVEGGGGGGGGGDDTGDKDTNDTGDKDTNDTGADDTGDKDTNDTGDKDTNDTGDKGDDVVPETYADFTLPEGMELDAPMLEHFTPMMKELELSQDKAQKLVSTYGEFVKARDEAQEKEREDNYTAQVGEWEKTTKEDKELGGDNFDDTKRLSALALDKLNRPSLNEFLDTYGVGSHPDILYMLRTLGSMMDEDKPGGGSPNSSEKSDAEKLYGTDEDKK